MTHISLEQIRAMRAGTLAGDERHELVDHILDCRTCATRFKAMNALHTELETRVAPRRPRVLPYLAAAAILMLGLMLFRSGPVAEPSLTATAFVELERAPSLDLLDRVHDLNLRAALDDWGDHTDLRDLISIQNRR